MLPGSERHEGNGIGGTALFIHKSFRIMSSGISEDGYLTWAQVTKEGHEFFVASVYGPHSPGARAAHWTALRNMFPHTEIILCGDWNMVQQPADSSGERQVLSGAEATAFLEFSAKHNLQDVRELAAENQGPVHTRWSAYGGNPRWARLDRIYVSHGGR